MENMDIMWSRCNPKLKSKFHQTFIRPELHNVEALEKIIVMVAEIWIDEWTYFEGYYFKMTKKKMLRRHKCWNKMKKESFNVVL